MTHAMQIAVILGAPHMRIFSYLRYSGFRPADLNNETDLRKLLGLAGHYDTLQLENEPVCNVGNIAELAAFFRPAEESSENTEVEEENSRSAPATARNRSTYGRSLTSPMPGRPANGRAMPTSQSLPLLPPRST